MLKPRAQTALQRSSSSSSSLTVSKPSSWGGRDLLLRALHTAAATGMSLGVCVPAPAAWPLPTASASPSPATPPPPSASWSFWPSSRAQKDPRASPAIIVQNLTAWDPNSRSFCKELTQTFLYLLIFQIIDPVCLVLQEFFIPSLQFGWCKLTSPLEDTPATGRFLLRGLRSC